MLAFSKPTIAQKLKAKTGGGILNVLASEALRGHFFYRPVRHSLSNQQSRRHRPDFGQRHSRIIAGEIADTVTLNRIPPLSVGLTAVQSCILSGCMIDNLVRNKCRLSSYCCRGASLVGFAPWGPEMPTDSNREGFRSATQIYSLDVLEFLFDGDGIPNLLASLGAVVRSGRLHSK